MTLKANNLLNSLVGTRYWYYETSEGEGLVYENCPEEGDQVRKRLFKGTPEDAKKFMSTIRGAFKDWLKRSFKITRVGKSLEQPTSEMILSQCFGKKSKEPKPEVLNQERIKLPKTIIISSDSFDPEAR